LTRNVKIFYICFLRFHFVLYIDIYQNMNTKPELEDFMAMASARHILVDSKEKCEELKSQILAGSILLRLQSSTQLVLPGRKAAI